jgi:hypothetical protein
MFSVSETIPLYEPIEYFLEDPVDSVEALRLRLPIEALREPLDPVDVWRLRLMIYAQPFSALN